MYVRVTTPGGTATAPVGVTGGVSPHAHFDALRSLPECIGAWSLRDQEQINNISGSSYKDNRACRYLWASGADDYHTPHDACRIRIPAGESFNYASGGQQLWMGMPQHEPTRLLLTWSHWWGPEWRSEPTIGPVWRALKTWQVMKGSEKGWWTVYNTFNVSKPDPRQISVVGNAMRGSGVIPGVQTKDLIKPTGLGAAPRKTYAARFGQWMQYVVEIRYFQPPEAFTAWSEHALEGAPMPPNPNDPEGRWHMSSQWVIDDRGVQRILYQIPTYPDDGNGWPTTVRRFRVEMNTSQSGRVQGDLTAYTRNVVALHGYTLPEVPDTDPLIFQRPVP